MDDFYGYNAFITWQRPPPGRIAHDGTTAQSLLQFLSSEITVERLKMLAALAVNLNFAWKQETSERDQGGNKEWDDAMAKLPKWFQPLCIAADYIDGDVKVLESLSEGSRVVVYVLICTVAKTMAKTLLNIPHQSGKHRERSLKVVDEFQNEMNNSTGEPVMRFMGSTGVILLSRLWQHAGVNFNSLEDANLKKAFGRFYNGDSPNLIGIRPVESGEK